MSFLGPLATILGATGSSLAKARQQRADQLQAERMELYRQASQVRYG